MLLGGRFSSLNSGREAVRFVFDGEGPGATLSVKSGAQRNLPHFNRLRKGRVPTAGRPLKTWWAERTGNTSFNSPHGNPGRLAGGAQFKCQ